MDKEMYSQELGGVVMLPEKSSRTMEPSVDVLLGQLLAASHHNGVEWLQSKLQAIMAPSSNQVGKPRTWSSHPLEHQSPETTPRAHHHIRSTSGDPRSPTTQPPDLVQQWINLRKPQVGSELGGAGGLFPNFHPLDQKNGGGQDCQ